MKKISILALSAAMFVVSCKENKTDSAITTTEQEAPQKTGATYTIAADSSDVK